MSDSLTRRIIIGTRHMTKVSGGSNRILFTIVLRVGRWPLAENKVKVFALSPVSDEYKSWSMSL